MIELIELIEQELAAAKAAYANDPTPAKKAAAVDLVRKLAAAKKADAPVIDLAAQLKAAKQAQEDREIASRLESRIEAARRLYERAEEWPRCLENWPANASEKNAQKLIEKYGV